MAIPLQHGQLSCRELVVGEEVVKDIKINEPIFVDSMDTPYGRNEKMRIKFFQEVLTLIQVKKALSQQNNLKNIIFKDCFF